MKLPSQYQIGDDVSFKQDTGASVSDDGNVVYGQVVKVSFTRAKVLYGVLDDYGNLWHEIDSAALITKPTEGPTG